MTATNTINGWGVAPIIDTPPSGWSANLQPGTYVIGDPAYVLTEEECSELGSRGGQRFCTVSNHKQILLIDSGGDRLAYDHDGREYPIDTGRLAVVRAEHASVQGVGLAHEHNFPEGACLRLNEWTGALTFSTPALVIEEVAPPPEEVDDGYEPDCLEVASANHRTRVERALGQLKGALSAAIDWDTIWSPETAVDTAAVLRELAEHVRDEQRRWSGEEVAHG